MSLSNQNKTSSTPKSVSSTSLPASVDKNADVVLQGYKIKLKTLKKKYFVLYSDGNEKLARLEYYDSEKKFKTSRTAQPKRSIILKSIMINRRTDTKHKYVIALYTKEDFFGIIFESESELNRWLRALLALQRGEEIDDDPPKPTFGEYIFIYLFYFFNVISQMSKPTNRPKRKKKLFWQKAV